MKCETCSAFVAGPQPGGKGSCHFSPPTPFPMGAAPQAGGLVGAAQRAPNLITVSIWPMVDPGDFCRQWSPNTATIAASTVPGSDTFGTRDPSTRDET